MKKSLVIALALTFVLSIGQTAFAAANPFVDVPGKHWAYDAVDKLTKAGIVEGYGDKTFRGDRTMTRYEMAEIVGKAMAKSDKADAALKALIDKLAVEFAAELNTLGVRVAKLEKSASSIKFWGDARIRYQKNYDMTGAAFSNGQVYRTPEHFQERIRLYAQADLSDRTQFQGRVAAVNTSEEGYEGRTGPLQYEYAKFVFKNFGSGMDLELGRNTLFLGQGLIADTDGYFDSVKVTFGSGSLQGFYAYGDIRPATTKTFGAGSGSEAVNISALNLSWAAAKDWTVTGAILKSHSVYYPYDIYAIGTQGKFSDFTLTAEWAKNTSDAVELWGNTKAWYTSLWYKGADRMKVGTWGVYVDYRSVAGHAVDADLYTLNAPFGWGYSGPHPVQSYPGMPHGNKGFGYGFNYTFAKNAVFTFSYENLSPVFKPARSWLEDYKPFIYAKAEMWF